MKRICFLLFVYFAFVSFCCVHASEVRTWSSRQGSKLQASLVEDSNGYATLKKADGSTLKVKITSLSSTDQKYLKDLKAPPVELEEEAKKVEEKKEEAPPPDVPWPIGGISEEIKTKKDPKWSYRIYLPKGYRLDRNWPVMFVMSPNGGNKNTLKRYVDGAEFNDWILAVSIQSKNGFEASGDAMMAMVDDVSKRFPVDSKRMYSSGFSGGARMAFLMAENLKKKDFAGVLPCGAGGLGRDLSSKTVIYGLGGSNGFNRWDMACTFKGLKNSDSHLKFFIGNHAWAESLLIKDGMIWLNLCCLKEAQLTEKKLIEEKKVIIAKVLKEIEMDIESNPERAYIWAEFLAKRNGLKPKEAATLMRDLAKNPKVKAYLLAVADVERFVKKHFATNVMDYLNNNGTKESKRDSEIMAEKHKDTILSGLITKMGDPAPVPGGGKKKK